MRDAIVLGLALAVLVVLAFTMSPLSALVAAVVVPCTVAITFVVMKVAGLTFNMMTLGGLAAGIGLFIDNAIVMTKRFIASRGRPVRGDCRGRGAQELAASAARFDDDRDRRIAPLVFTSGVTGVFFRSLAATLGGGLAISLVLAIYFTPAMELAIARFRGRAREAGRIYRGVQTAFLTAIVPSFVFPRWRFPARCFAPRRVPRLQQYGTVYLPPLDEGAFVLDYIPRRRDHAGRHDGAARLDSVDPEIDT